MKLALITTFAFAVMVCAFNVNPVTAGDMSKPWASSQINNFGRTAYDASKCWLTSSGEVNCENPDYMHPWKVEDNDSELIARDAELGDYVYCWGTIGRNGSVTMCVPDEDWDSEDNVNEQTASSDGHDRGRQNWNDWVEEIQSAGGDGVYRCKQRTDGAIMCPGNAWNEEGNDGSLIAYPHSPQGFWCGSAICPEDSLDRDPDQSDNGRDVTDSGNESSTSAVSTSDQ